MEGVKPKSSYDYRKGHWVSFDEWPNQPSIKPLYLSTNSTLSDEKNFEKTIISSPQTCGLDGGEYCAIWLGPELPGDQRVDDAQSVIFTTEQLGDELDIVGAPEVKLKLRSFTSTAQIAVRLNHIHPDGASTRITYGVFNLGHVDGHDKPRKLKKGEAVTLAFNLDQIAYRVSKGHKIRLSISNSYWPLLWPTPDNGQIEIIEGKLNESHDDTNRLLSEKDLVIQEKDDSHYASTGRRANKGLLDKRVEPLKPKLRKVQTLQNIHRYTDR